MVERFDHLTGRLAVAAEYGFDLEAAKFEHLAAASGDCLDLFRIDRLREKLFGGHRRANNNSMRATAHRCSIGHVIDVPVSEQNYIGAFHIRCLETKRRIHAATVEVRVEQ